MNIELATDLFAQQLVDRSDPQRAGAFIEIGLGGANFSFAWAAPRGFRCHAIEPLPTADLLRTAGAHEVPVTIAAVAAERGEVPIYLGALNGNSVPDLNSLNPRWWGTGGEVRRVPALTLADFFSEKAITRATLLKIDTEGSEFTIIGGLSALRTEQRPEIVIFEYGGGGSRTRKTGGWTEEFFASTEASLATLRDLGYGGGILLESTLSQPRRIDFAALDALASIFPAHAEVGNLIVLRDTPAPAVVAALWQNAAGALRRDAWRRAARERWHWFNHHRIRVLSGLGRRLWPRGRNK